MADNSIRLVPTDENFLPSRDAAEEAAAALRQFAPHADEVTFHFSESVEFIDAGANWEGVRCPACNADIEEWWQEQMSEASDRRFADLSCITPCCGKATSLNALDYPWPVAFARFVLEAMNPDLWELAAEQQATVERLLGTEVKHVWQHL